MLIPDSHPVGHPARILLFPGERKENNKLNSIRKLFEWQLEEPFLKEGDRGQVADGRWVLWSMVKSIDLISGQPLYLLHSQLLTHSGPSVAIRSGYYSISTSDVDLLWEEIVKLLSGKVIISPFIIILF